MLKMISFAKGSLLLSVVTMVFSPSLGYDGRDQEITNSVAAAAPKLRGVLPKRGPAATTSRGLASYKSCCFEGECRDAGQWLKGPRMTCMCDRKGTGAWRSCQHNSKAFKSAEVSWKDGDEEPLTALGVRKQFLNTDFVFDLLGSVPGAITDGGTIQAVGVDNLPSLKGQGLAYSLFTIEPCGINLPHVHPRATELLYVIEGGYDALRTAFVEENGGRVITNDIGKGDVTFFPQGLVHYQQNLSCETATYLSALNNEDPGVSTISTQFFELPREAIESSLGEGASVVDQLVNGLPSGPGEGRESCLKKCNLW